MPYIQIKAWPKDEQIKKEVAEEITKLFEEKWGCPRAAVTLSFEEILPENWQTVTDNEIEPNKDKMYILNGQTIK